MNPDEWEADLRWNLNSGEVWEPLEHEEAWWRAWAERIASAPLWEAESPKSQPTLKVFK